MVDSLHLARRATARVAPALGLALALGFLCSGDSVAESRSSDARGPGPRPADGKAVPTGSAVSRAQIMLGLSREQLLPRIGSQLERLSAARNAVIPGSGPLSLMDEGMSESVRRGVTRSTRHAMKDYLLETTELDRRLEAWKDGLRRRHFGADVAPDGGAGGEVGEPRRVRFDLGFHHLRPQVEMRYDVGPGALRLRLDSAGMLKVGYGGPRMESTTLEASYDGDAFQFGFGFGF